MLCMPYLRSIGSKRPIQGCELFKMLDLFVEIHTV